MCGIVGYVGKEQAAPILLDGLARLEYRGYDSAGVAVYSEKNQALTVRKAKGRLQVLSDLIQGGAAVDGTVGIGHTRWATHGEPSTVNAHPQYTREKRVVIVHNGIIENYQEIKESLLKKGYTFASQTDTEVAAALLDSYYAEAAKRESDPRARALDAIRNTMIRVRGSYALGILFGDQPGVIYAARKDSPLILGRCDGEYQGHMIASDVPAVLNYTRNVVYIDNQEIACLTRDELHVYNIDCEEIEKSFVEIKWDAAAAEKDGYEHFMMKEIHEQPRAVRDTLSPRIKENESGERYIDLSETGLTDEDFAAVSRVYLIGCGSAYHVGMAARYVLEKAARVPCEVDLASEFRYRDPILEESGLVIIISQSGETADSLAALRLCKERAVDPYDLELDAGKLALILQLLSEGKIDRAGARNTLEAVFADDADVEAYIKKEKLAIERDETAVAGAIAQVLAENADAVEKFRAGNEKVMGFLTGQCMKLLRGKADPKQVSAALLEALR